MSPKNMDDDYNHHEWGLEIHEFMQNNDENTVDVQ